MMRKIRLTSWAVILLLAGITCTTPRKTADKSGTLYTAKFTFKKITGGSPPAQFISLDIELENKSDSTRWFVFPARSQDFDFDSYPVSAVHFYKYCKDSCAWVATASSGEEFETCNMLSLAPNSKVILNNFRIQDVRTAESNDTTKLNVWVCRDIRIDSVEFKKLSKVSMLNKGNYAVDFAEYRWMKQEEHIELPPWSKLNFEIVQKLNSSIVIK